MTIFATNGTRIFIGRATKSKSTDFILSDFAAASSSDWEEIGEVEGLGTVGDTSAEITFDSIPAQRTRRLKGTRNAGTQDMICGIDYEDPGQLKLLAAEKTPYDYEIRMVLNDAPPGGTPSERLYIAKVASVGEQFDSANSVMKLAASLWVNSNIVKVAATEG